MSYVIVGLGNPGEEYVGTRHNTGRDALAVFAEENNFSEWKPDLKTKSLISSGKIGKETVTLIAPETFMNKSGISVDKIQKSLKVKTQKGVKNGRGKKEIENLVVVHDDLDIPFGKFKISFNKSSGGHRGVESIVKVLKTDGFGRIRVGISPANSKGVAKKPVGEEVINKFILGKFKPAEAAELKKLYKVVSKALTLIISDGISKAMSQQGSF